MNAGAAAQSRLVLFVSDRTGLTAEAYGRSLLAQFPGLTFEGRRFAFIDNPGKAGAVAAQIGQIIDETGVPPIVFMTLVEPATQKIIGASGGCVIDLFSTFLAPLEHALGVESAHKLGLSQRIFGTRGYQTRLNAIEYALNHDDGVRPDQYPEADVILIGVSRCGKTPTSLYLAMNFFIKVANYPLTDHELERDRLPDLLAPLKSRLVALTIAPKQLANIRQQRRPGSSYASTEVCQREVRAAESIYRDAGVPIFDVTDTSIEEIAGWIMKEKELTQVSG